MTNSDLLVDIALQEDLKDIGDVTSKALIDPAEQAEIFIVSRSSGTLSGIEIAEKVFRKVNEELIVTWHFKDGDSLEKGSKIASVKGALIDILKAERTVLNFICHLSGVATLTSLYVSKLEAIGSKTKIRDTRKTTPGYRDLEKQAVVHGGGVNHRLGLYDAFLVKDNHLTGTNIDEVVSKCRDFNNQIPLEVEVDSLEQLLRVAEQKPDLILLDNFTPELVQEAIDLNLGIPFEISGGVNLDNVQAYGKSKVEFIAVGALTHSAPILDIGFDAK